MKLQSAGIWLRDHELLHALRAAKVALAHALPAEVWRDPPRWLEGATAYLATQDQGLVFGFEVATPHANGKIVVRVDYNEKIRQGGKRSRITSNFVRTGEIVEPHNLKDERYVELER